MKSKRIITVFMTAILAAAMCIPAFAADTDSAGNIFEADETVSFNSDSFFGAFAAGRSVSVSDSEAEGSVFEAGQDVSINSTDIGESLFIAGNTVTAAETRVHGNIFAAGNNVVIGNGTEANGVYAFGSALTFAGEANALYAAGGSVTVSGVINGDAYIEGDNVIITEDAVITGTLKIASANDPEVSDDSTVGDFEYEQINRDEQAVSASRSFGSIVWDKIKSCLFWVVAMGAFAMLLVWLFSEHLTSAAELIRTKPGVMIGTGVITWLCVPIAALILCISRILAPIAGMLMLAYVLLLCAGLAFAGASLVRLFLPNMNVYLSALIGVAVLEVIRMIPVLGFIVGCVADMYLLAYVIQRIWSRRSHKEEVANV